MAQCIDLEKHFGKRFKTGRDPAYDAEHGKYGRVEDPWTMTVLARFGHFFPWGGDRIAASCDGHTSIAGVLRRLPCCRIEQDGDCGEVTASFAAEDFDQVAAVMKPRRRPKRRPMTDEEKVRLVEAGRAHRFQSSSTGNNPDPSDLRREKTVLTTQNTLK